MVPVTKILKRDGSEVPYRRDRIATAIGKAAVSVGIKDEALPKALADKVDDLLHNSHPTGSTPTVEEIQDLVEQVLVESGHALISKAYILYRFRRSQMRRGDLGVQEGGRSRTIPWRLLWSTLAWNSDHDCDNFDRLNSWVGTGRFGELVAAGDRQYERQLDWAAEDIFEKQGVRLIFVAGPSSSGKTTTTTKIGERLKSRGLELVTMNLDNYYRDLDTHPKDEYGDYDYETPEALDLPLINEHLERLVAGKEILAPRYDFQTGRQIRNQTPMRLEKNQLLLLDSLHGLHGDLSENLSDDLKFKIYIETFCQVRPKGGRYVRWTDVRLLRRMVRDRNFRNHSPELTLGHWHYVRRSEMRQIVPFLGSVDFVINGSLPYELPLLKKHVWGFFPDLVRHYEAHPERQDAIIRGRRLLDVLEQIKPATDDDESKVPGDSLLREFIGGSTLKY
ncbi:MAG: ATP cone domain-containing protein [Pseudomonadota bacterium]